MRQRILLQIFLVILFLGIASAGWGNGKDFSSSVRDWDYGDNFGTQDYLAALAISWLPEEEVSWINENALFYGTSLPDSTVSPEAIKDYQCCQWLIISEDGQITNDIAAVRAKKEYEKTLEFLNKNKLYDASRRLGVTMHYISDAGFFGNVIGGYKKIYRDYESYVEMKADMKFPAVEFEREFGDYIKFDGSLDPITPYDAAVKVASAVHSGKGISDPESGVLCSAEWMEENFNALDPHSVECTGRTLNLIANTLADLTHTLYLESHGVEPEFQTQESRKGNNISDKMQESAPSKKETKDGTSEGGAEPTEDKTAEDKTTEDKTTEDKTAEDKTAEDKTTEDKTTEDKTTGSETTKAPALPGGEEATASPDRKTKERQEKADLFSSVVLYVTLFIILVVVAFIIFSGRKTDKAVLKSSKKDKKIKQKKGQAKL